MSKATPGKNFQLLRPDVLARNWDENQAGTTISRNHNHYSRIGIANGINHLCGYSPRVLFSRYYDDGESGHYSGSIADDIIAAWAWGDYWTPGDEYEIRIYYISNSDVTFSIGGSTDIDRNTAVSTYQNDTYTVSRTVTSAEETEYISLTEPALANDGSSTAITYIFSIVVQEIPKEILLDSDSHPGVFSVIKTEEPIRSNDIEECRSSLHSIYSLHYPPVFHFSSNDENTLLGWTTQQNSAAGFLVTSGVKANIFDLSSTSRTTSSPGFFVPAFGCGLGSGTTVRMHCRARLANYNFSAGDTGTITFQGPNGSTTITIDNDNSSSSSFTWFGLTSNYITLNTDKDWDEATTAMNKVDVLAKVDQASTGIYISSISCWLELIPSDPTYYFRSTFQSTGVSNLDQDITLNSTTKSPTFWYEGKDTTSASTLTAGVGTDIPLTNTGTDPTINLSAPFTDGTEGIRAENGDYYEYSNNTLYDFTNEDLVFEICFCTGDDISNTNYIVYKADGSDGWSIHITGGDLRCYVRDGGVSVVTVIGSVEKNTVYLAHVIMDRSGNCQGYLNATAGTPQDISGIASISNTSIPVRFLKDDKITLYHIGCWNFGSGGLDGSTQQAFVNERLYKLSGVYPSVADGTDAPTVCTRASRAALTNWDTTNSKYESWFMGDGFPRVERTLDNSDAVFIGLLSEPSVDNLAEYSNAGASWTIISGDSVTAEDSSHPSTVYGYNLSGLVSDTDSEFHYVKTPLAGNPTVGNTTHCFSVQIEEGTSDYVQLRVVGSTLGTKKAWFDFSSTPVAGTKDSGVVNDIIDLGNGKYRAYMSLTVQAESMDVFVGPADGDGSSLYSAGDGSSVDVWTGLFQFELGEYPSSYIDVPSTASVGREPEVLRYKAYDGNLGGVDQQGKIYVDVLLKDFDTYSNESAIFCLNDGSSDADKIYCYCDTEKFKTTISADGSDIHLGGSTDIRDGAVHVLLVEYESDDAKIYNGAGLDSSTSSVNIPDDIDRINIGCDEGDTNQPRGHIRNFSVVPK